MHGLRVVAASLLEDALIEGTLLRLVLVVAVGGASGASCASSAGLTLMLRSVASHLLSLVDK